MPGRLLVLLTCLAALAVPAAAAPIDLSPVARDDPGSTLPRGWQHGAFMEIFVRAWRDSDGDGIGDLRGLIGGLPYLKDLGIRAVWLMPITANADHEHGYATTDHRAIAPEYGTLADFDALIARAHALGIGVIMDYVVNHSAASHPLFVAARSDRGSPWRDWFVWSADAPAGWSIWGRNPWHDAGTQPWASAGQPGSTGAPQAGASGIYSGTFGPHMPDFDLRNPAVWQYHLDSLRFWLNRGLDGFRLDAVPHLVENGPQAWNDQPQSRRLTKQLQDLVAGYDNRWVVCEATADPLA